jgi:hypothetical protein
MTDKTENQAMTDTQPAYDPPQALRMGAIRAGAGQCEVGSGDQDYCYPGNNAAGEGCMEDGSAALGNCSAGPDVLA